MKPGAGVVVVNPNCRKCGRMLVDESDLLVGLCNNDKACAQRVAIEEAFASLVAASEEVKKATKRYGDALALAGLKSRCPTCGTFVDPQDLPAEVRT